MKKALFVLVAAVAMLGLMSCTALFGTKPAATSDVSTWWVKGSWDGWKGGADGSADPGDGSRHFFKIDAANSKLVTYAVTGLTGAGGAFVLSAPDGTIYRAPSTATLVPGTGTTFVTKATAGSADAAYYALYTSYTIQVNITVPTAPVVTLVAGTTATTPATFAALSAALVIAGDQFTSAWDETKVPGVVNATAGTVTFDMTVIKPSGGFYIKGLDGYMKFPALAVPSTTAAAAATTGLYNNYDSNATLTIDTTKVGKKSVYSIVVTIDPAATSIPNKYKVAVSLKTLVAETTPSTWTSLPWTAVFVPGTISSWTAGSFGVATQTTTTSNIWTYKFTAAATDAQFKIVPANAWGLDLGFADIVAGTTGTGVQTLVNTGGNIAFTAVVGTAYTITVDFTAADFGVTGTPKVTVTTP
jgi:hypothetical protein